MKDLNDMTRRELEKVPHRKWKEDIGEFDALIILPATVPVYSVVIYRVRLLLNKVLPKVFTYPEIYDIKGLHDSGYRAMDYIACRGNKPICRLSGCSDVIHLDGIGGYGKNWLDKYGGVPNLIPPKGWSMDCLRASGLLRIFCHRYKLTTDNMAVSSFELYADPERKAKKSIKEANV